MAQTMSTLVVASIPALPHKSSLSISAAKHTSDRVSIHVTSRSRARPLPLLPTQRHVAHPKPGMPTQNYTTPLLHALNKPPEVEKPKPRPHHTLARHLMLRTLLDHPRILSHVLGFSTWEDYHSLSSSCRDFREIISHPDLRDVILSQYVPGYQYCLYNRDLELYREVQIDMHDLSLLMISQDIPLHKFPMHALSTLSSPLQLPGFLNQNSTTSKYVELAQVHSRFILLLQSLVHSSSAPGSLEEQDDLGELSSSRFSEQNPLGVRELVFPAPLSYFDPASKGTAELPNQKATFLAAGKGPKRSSTSRPVGSPPPSLSPPRASADMQPLLTRTSTKRRLRRSIFGTANAPPPPSSAPQALKYYSSSWRRTLASSRGMNVTSISDDEGDGLFNVKAPHRRFTSVNLSTDSSLSSRSPSSSRSNADYPPSPWQVPREAPMSAPYTGATPHDLTMATSRSRAPLLRVFVPCTELDEFAISACEEQLVDAGLWEHLSAGDIVCNFGYVPPPDTDEDSQSSGESERTGHRKKWLVFNGYCLVHYIPPSPPPIVNCMSLPSPFYFSHILPTSSNPRYILSLPPLPASPSPGRQGRASLAHSHMHLTLAHLPTHLPSPHSPLGYVLVKKYMWLARVPFAGLTEIEGGVLPGEGWKGEWILEAEGTREGRQSLIDALRAGKDGFGRRGLWEIVKEKSGNGRLWMRLLNANVDPTEQGLDYNDTVPSSEIVSNSPRTS